ncbi:poly-gamma-glutamate hydrolase family protein [Bacillus sp. NPDC077027]|uniref:poly-gamma-glutamate hydrolase family protein n=1 Tax=Bacillus sp. NPDC077027 TaxID=3390548 RepID=UPI003CFCC935
MKKLFALLLLLAIVWGVYYTMQAQEQEEPLSPGGEDESGINDIYRNFKELEENESSDNYQITYNQEPGSRLLVMSPHGGRIEGGVSEIVHFFDNEYSTYLFEGLRENAFELHITSTNFDEPIGVQLAKAHDYVLAVHGYRGEVGVDHTLVGGTDFDRAEKIVNSLERNGFSAELAVTHTTLSGTSTNNINNLTKTGQSVQLEISRSQREALFDRFDYRRRSSTKNEHFYRYVRAIRSVLDEEYT